jgi:hypothetical protein
MSQAFGWIVVGKIGMRMELEEHIFGLDTLVSFALLSTTNLFCAMYGGES